MLHRVTILMEYDESRKDEVEELVSDALDQLCGDDTHETCISWVASESTAQEEVEKTIHCMCECCWH